MDEYINKHKLANKIEVVLCKMVTKGFISNESTKLIPILIKCILRFPAENVAPVVHGKWTRNETMYTDTVCCSICGEEYAKEGDKILDTHLGSGSSRIAAYNLGFDFVGCEIDKDYFTAQEERFEKHTAQQNLFLEVNT